MMTPEIQEKIKQVCAAHNKLDELQTELKLLVEPILRALCKSQKGKEAYDLAKLIPECFLPDLRADCFEYVDLNIRRTHDT
jgi:hypothetical protein